MSTEYSSFFSRVTDCAPHQWQVALGDEVACRDRAIRIPTGFGKTAGVVLAWLHRRVICGDDAWPRRLVFCLPMRVLVEQTERVVKGWLERARMQDVVGVHVLMGGVRANQWVLRLDQPAVLIGTQDMLLSRALNRGYGAARGLWPMEHGLLHQDALWALDEVQLMDVGLATSAQLAAFRDQDSAKPQGQLRPAHTWWMSATLQPRWLKTVDHNGPPEAPLSIPAAERMGGLFDVRKPLVRDAHIRDADGIAACARARHVPGTLTLVVVNRVSTALAVYDALASAFGERRGKKVERRHDAPELELVHSRFRGLERSAWADRFLRRDAPLPDAGRIVVATQVVEAGVDISSRTLVTELAPWSSLVQRFGRVARYAGESGSVVVVGRVPADAKEAAPYAARELGAAVEGLTHLLAKEADGSPRTLEAFEDELARVEPALLARLYPYEPLHVLRRRDLDDLFDTSADLSGAELDVSRYIRSGDERDVSVFWRSFEESPQVRIVTPPRREELCPVPVGDIRAWKGKAYVLDYLDGVWTERDVKRLVPGMTVLLHASQGGYTAERGWGGKVGSIEPVPLAPEVEDAESLVVASSSEDGETLSAAPWKTISTHGRETEREARRICETLVIPDTLARVVALAGRWHDVGKAHQVFQDAIKSDARHAVPMGARRDLAKAPDGAWRRPPYPARPGFRHELASTLALFELLHRTNPFHPALLGPHRALFDAVGTPVTISESGLIHPLAREIAELSGADFDLLAWLVCSHHGKVRCVWTSTPHDQKMGHGGIHGVCEGDELPAFSLGASDGSLVDEVPALTLSLAAASMGIGTRYGASWAERVGGLLARFGPFTLTFLEAVLRVADVRASRLATEEPHA